MRDHVRLATKPRRWQHPGEMPTEECIVWGIAERWAAPGLALLAAAVLLAGEYRVLVCADTALLQQLWQQTC